MIFKIYCNKEIHRVRDDIKSYDKLIELIINRFEGKIPQNFCCEYNDCDGDYVRINCQEDFQILLEELESTGSKTAKIYIKEDLNSTLMTLPTLQLQEDLKDIKDISKESFENVSEILKEEPEVEIEEVEKLVIKAPEPEVIETPLQPNPMEENSVLKVIENSVLKSVTVVNTDQLMAIFHVAKENRKEVMRWVSSKETNDMEELVNLYMTEMIDKFPVIEEEDEVIIEDEQEEEPVEEAEIVNVQENDKKDDTIEMIDVVEEKVPEPEKVEETEIVDKCEEKEEDDLMKPDINWTLEQWGEWKNDKKSWNKKEWKDWKENWKTKWTEDEWKEWEEKYGKYKKWKAWKGCCQRKGGWQRRRKWFHQKFETKFDESIRKAIPQIAVQVAQILRKDQEKPNNNGFAPLKDLKIQEEQHQVVHKGYVCDGCGMSPIVGICYKSSVLKDFDFCEKCEATIPHPYPFLKLKTPEQRPHALFTVINEEGKQPFTGDNIPEMFGRVKDLFKGFCKGKMNQTSGNKCPFTFIKEMVQQFKQQNEQPKQEQKVEEKVEEVVETPKEEPKKEEKKPEPVVKVVSVDPVVLANTQQLMEIFSVDESQKEHVMKWVEGKKGRSIERLVNLFMDEMSGKF